MLFRLVKLISVVECHLLDALVRRISNERLGLAWMGVDDAGRINAHAEHLVNLGLGGAVKAGPELGQEAHDTRVWIAFDGWECRY